MTAPVNEDLAEFAKWHIASGDIDPAYPVLAALTEALCDNDDETLRFIFLYVTYYDLPSAIGAWKRGVFRQPGCPPDDLTARFPTGTERRAHRSPRKLVAHLADLDHLANKHGSLTNWLLPATGENPHENWVTSQVLLQQPHGNGRWAAYKTGEILATVLGWPLQPTDAGHAFSSGPRKGLADCYPATEALTGFTPDVVDQLDTQTAGLQRWLSDRLDNETPVEQIETVLCDWHSTLKGGYYIGHDIDQMLSQTTRARNRGVIDDEIVDDLTRIRANVFAPRWLGEANNWVGVRPALKNWYKDHGVLKWWDWA